MTNEKLLNVKEVSDFLNVSESCVYNYAKEKEIPVIKIKGRVLFSQEDLNKWIKSKKQTVKD